MDELTLSKLKDYNIVYKGSSPEPIYICTNDLLHFDLYMFVVPNKPLKLSSLLSLTIKHMLKQSYLLYYNKNYMRRKYKDFDLDDALKLTY